MSILQEYEQISNHIGKKKYNAINEYLNIICPKEKYEEYEIELRQYNHLSFEDWIEKKQELMKKYGIKFLDDILYKKEEWENFEKWYNSKKNSLKLYNKMNKKFIPLLEEFIIYRNIESCLNTKNKKMTTKEILDLKEIILDFFNEDSVTNFLLSCSTKFITDNYLDNNISMEELKESTYYEIYNAIEYDDIKILNKPYLSISKTDNTKMINNSREMSSLGIYHKMNKNYIPLLEEFIVYRDIKYCSKLKNKSLSDDEIIELKEIVLDFFNENSKNNQMLSHITKFITNNYLDNNISIRQLKESSYYKINNAIERENIKLLNNHVKDNKKRKTAKSKDMER